MEGFNPTVFRWARESAGLDLDGAARALHIQPASLQALEAGTAEPSYTQLQNMSKAYRRPLLTFYMAEPPAKGERGQDFRTVAADRQQQDEAGLDALVRTVEARAAMVRAVLEDDEDAERLSFVASASLDSGAIFVAQDIMNTLHLDIAEYRKAKDVEQSFKVLRDRAEAAGIFVLLVGDVGSHHSAIPVEVFRGFALADPLAPFVVINPNDAKGAWAFTLLHELAHIWIGASGVSAGAPDHRVERFCNAVAAHILVPEQELIARVPLVLATADLLAALDVIARDLKVTRSMLAYGLFRAGRLGLEEWQSLDNELRDQWRAERRREKEAGKSGDSGGPSYFMIRRHRLGKALLTFADHNLRTGNLTPVKAAQVLGVAARNVYPLLAG